MTALLAALSEGLTRDPRMIPKLIHYCWFGGSAQSTRSLDCLASWRNILPDYEIKRWDESNTPMDIPYLQNAAANGKWANMSNLVRLHALVNEGGIYLDTDVEVIKSFDDLLFLPAFVGCESKTPKVNNAVCGSRPGHRLFKVMASVICRNYPGNENANEAAPELLTHLLRNRGLTSYPETPRLIADVMVLPIQYFYPLHFGEVFRPQCVTPDTYTIHYWEKRW
jgi:hypothetical protein